MTNDRAAPERPHRYRTNRLEAFSDGVFAIAVYLLIPYSGMRRRRPLDG